MEYEVRKNGESNGISTKWPEDVYNIIENITGDERESIEASEWCEQAEIGDTYEKDEFVITVVEA